MSKNLCGFNNKRSLFNLVHISLHLSLHAVLLACFKSSTSYGVVVRVCVVCVRPPQLWQVQMSDWWQRCVLSPHRAHCRCKLRPRLPCRPGRRSAGCPCWGSLQTWRTERTDAPRLGSPDQSLLPPAKRDTWWILGVQEGRMDRQTDSNKRKEEETKPSCRELVARSRRTLSIVHTHR